MNIESRLVRPLVRRLARTMRIGRRFVVLSALSTIGLASLPEGTDAIGPDSAESERQIVFRHFV